VPGGDDTPQAPAEETVLGLTVVAATDETRDRYGIEAGTGGLVVLSVEADSDAFAKGIQEGDLITEAGQEPVATPADLSARIKAAEDAGRKSILLLVRREGQPRFVALSLAS
jgi:serine protease Do